MIRTNREKKAQKSQSNKIKTHKSHPSNKNRQLLTKQDSLNNAGKTTRQLDRQSDFLINSNVIKKLFYEMGVYHRMKCDTF